MPVLVKSTGKPVHLGALLVNVATGVCSMLMVSTEVWVQFWSLIVKVTTLLPDEL